MNYSAEDLNKVVAEARERFTELVIKCTCTTGITPRMYQRYLSMQYHLTRGVQRYFFAAAAHSDFSRMPRFRKFLCSFASEEELHFLLAAMDLKEMGLSILSAPLDVELWHAYFSAEVLKRPFVRIGAACVLENLSGSENSQLFRRLLGASFLTSDNTKFLVLHMHEAVPHGKQIVAALLSEDLKASQLQDLVEGASKGATMYLRMAEWAMDETSLSAWSSKPGIVKIPAEELELAQLVGQAMYGG